MSKLFVKFISLVLILNLFFSGSGLLGISSVFGEEITPTDVPSTSNQQTVSPVPEIKPTVSIPAEHSEKPTLAPHADLPAVSTELETKPTLAPRTNTIPEAINTPVPTQPSQSPTVSPQSNILPADGASPTLVPQTDPTPTASSGSQSNSDGTGGSGSYIPSSTGGNVNDPANTLTGAFSTNNATENNNNWQEVLNNNMAQLENKINSVSSSGFNTANLNTMQGQVFSGDTASTLNLLNKLNSSMTGTGGFSVFNIYDAYLGDLVFKFADSGSSNGFASASSTVSKNSVTGPGSTNNAIADNSFKVKEANGNDAKIVNDINLQAVTGENTASYNTGNGNIKTGNATALGNIINLANTNLNVSNWLFGVVNIFGTLAGNIVLPQDSSNNTNNQTSTPVFAGNTSTGPLSTNNATYNNAETSNYTNNNTADITSKLDVSANSGNNTASINTGGGFVKTGSSDVAVSNSTIANTNTVKEEGTVWMVIVNEMGKWVGHIIGAPFGATTASDSLAIVQSNGEAGNQTYSTVSQNNGTGPGSKNNAAYNNTSDTTVENNNKAAISNNIIANADTGNNESLYNTGAGQIETGNAKTGLNLVNMANTNVTAKKFVAILVNVMGNFLGNIVTPEQKSASQIASAGTNNTLTPAKSPSPTVTPYQIPQFTVSANIGGTLTSGDMIAVNTIPGQNTGNNASDTAGNYSNSQNQYIASVAYVNKQIVTTKKIAQAYIKGTPIKSAVNNTSKRGVFISPAFTKATETSVAAVLLGGATFKVNEAWLSVIPFTLIFLALRRRKKIELGKYLNALLEIIL